MPLKDPNAPIDAGIIGIVDSTYKRM
jgi:microcompartment protein CcmK/EutM